MTGNYSHTLALVTSIQLAKQKHYNCIGDQYLAAKAEALILHWWSVSCWKSRSINYYITGDPLLPPPSLFHPFCSFFFYKLCWDISSKHTYKGMNNTSRPGSEAQQFHNAKAGKTGWPEVKILEFCYFCILWWILCHVCFPKITYHTWSVSMKSFC